MPGLIAFNWFRDPGRQIVVQPWASGVLIESGERRANVPGAEATLSKRIHGLDEDQARLVARSLSIFFDLANLAELCRDSDTSGFT